MAMMGARVLYYPPGEEFLPNITLARDAERQVIDRYRTDECNICAETEIVPAQRNGQEVYKIRITEWDIYNIGGNNIERCEDGLPLKL